MTSSSYFRYPHLHGDLITFVAEDDVWVAPLQGGRAWRVSSLQLPARNPRFSPDGGRLVWSVVQGSAPEVVSAAADGGDFRQLSYFGHQSTKVKGFTPSGDVLATSAFEQAESRHTWAYALKLDGSGRSLLPFGPVDSVAYGPQAGEELPVVISSVLSREPAWWKRYRGGTGGKLWIDPDGTGQFMRLAAELDGNLADPLWVKDRIAFLSDHEGYGNLYSVRPDGSQLRRHTDHEGFYARHASTDGTRIVFESAGSLFLIDSLDADPIELNITLGSASIGRRRKPLDVAKHLGQVVPDHTGRASAVEAHGTAHWLTHRDGPSRIVEATPGVRARLVRPLGEGKVIFVADYGGIEGLYLKDLSAGVEASSAASFPAGAAAPADASAGAPQGQSAVPPAGASAGAPDGQSPAGPSAGAQRVEFAGPTRASEIVTSPDGQRAAIATEYGQVLLLDVAKGTLREIASTDVGAIGELAFSPDSAWLLWVEPVTMDTDRSRLRLTHVADETADILDLTDGRFPDHGPAFTPDGRFVAFLSQRSFDPVYDTHGFDLSFPSSTKPFLLALAAGTPSPFGPCVAGTPAEPENLEPAQTGTGKDSSTPALVVDERGISERIIPVPVAQGNYEQLTAVEGAFLWLAGEPEGVTGDGRASTGDQAQARRLERFDIAKREISTLVPALDAFRASGDGKRVVVVHDGKVRLLPTAAAVQESSAESIEVDLHRIRVQLDPVKVWGQAFDEAWRLQRDFYWAPDMAGVDWKGVYDRYRPIVQRLGSHDDLVDLLWEIHGELGTSHAYVTPAPAAEPGAGQQGRLGADFRRTARGWEVERVLPGESSDPQARSPLTAAGAGVLPGDVLLRIDGVEIPATGPDVLLVDAADKVVELTIVQGSAHDDGAGQVRRIAVVPVKDEERLRYHGWVLENRRTVRRVSGGRFGYLHIPDMLARGWSQLHRDLDTETAQDGLLVDVRRNRGGHTSQLVAELIGRKMAAWTLARGQQPSIYPKQAPRGPVVILADEFAGSDGDIITQVAKLRGIGPVVGVRTWGGVIGIDGKFSLADGTAVTQPRYAFWFRSGVGWSVENYGVDPDIEIPFPPHAYAAGEDPQLERGLGILKAMLAEVTPDTPPARENYRMLQPGVLPPRPKAG